MKPRSTTCISLWVDRDLLHRARRMAGKQGMTLSQLIRKALADALDRWE